MLSVKDKPAPAVMSLGFVSKVRPPRNPKLLEEQHQETRITPSAFAHEMSLSTEQRLASTHAKHPPRILEVLDMSETTHQKFSSVDIDQALFQPLPSEIVFQNYTPFETYEVSLVLRNNDKIPHLVKVEEEDSLYFKVISPEEMCSKVAPGLASTFTVLFTPQENKDYIHRLICTTERERFEVPIRAVGARAILDFPDHLHFPVSPVKCLSQRTLLVRNVGNCDAMFQLSAPSPFSVDPPLGTLGVGHSMQVTVNFLPKTAGDYTEDLRLHYHTGEDIYISMYGAAADVNVRLDRNSVLMKRTYISMASQRCVTIANRSDVIVHYQWKCFGTEEEGKWLKLRPCSDLLREEEKKMEHFLTECTDNPMFRDHLSLLSRTFFKQQRRLREERLVFSGDHIIISPMEGDIWPNSTAEFTITFKPLEAKIYQQTVYCDVTGRESRLPLRVKGEGIGPSLEFSFDLLDMGNIFIHSKHSYEVLLSNKGYIDAPFRLVPPSSAQGHCFSFSPSEGTVPPGSCHAVVVCFSSGILGMFSEEILFAVEGNPQPISLTFRGRVMGPTFQFSVPELNFGDVSFGFPCSLTFQLNNTSLIPMSFNLRILGDGTGPPSISSMDLVSDPNRTDWAGHSDPMVRPVEFALSPSSGTVHAQGLVDIQVTLCSNCMQTCSLALVVDVQGVGEEVMALPIRARCVVPTVRLVASTLELEDCFLNHPFTSSVKLTNDTNLPACYGLLPQEYEEQPSFLYSSPHPRGIIQPRGETEIPLVLQAKVMGRLVVAAHIAVFGSEEPPLELTLSCVSEGPVVHVIPAELDFGSIPVLTDIHRTVRLLNQSPIPAPFLAQMMRRRSLWRVEPSEGVVPPEGELWLTLVARLDDTAPFHDKLHLAIEHSQARSIAVSAKGEGSTIVTDRPFAPSLDLGAHFSSGLLRYHFKLANQGRHSQQLYWMTDGFPPFWRRAPPLSRPGSSRGDKRPDSLHPPECDGPVFSLDPPRLELAPGQSADMVLTGASRTPKVVRERLVCQAIAGQQGGKRVIMTVDITCRFVSPVLELSTQELSFTVKKVPGVSLVPLYQPLILTNASSLSLSMELVLAKPFGLCDCPNDPSFTTSKLQVLGVGQQVKLWVRFDPCYGGDRMTRLAEEVLEIRHLEHPQWDSVGLRGEVHFPNLHFSSYCIDFGCILSHTEAQQRLTLTNRGLLPVAYRWLFLADQQHCYIRFPQETTLDMGHIPEEEQRRESQLDWSEKQGAISKMDRNTEFLKPLEEQLENERHDTGVETAEGGGLAREMSCSSSLLLGKTVLDGNKEEIHEVEQDLNASSLQAHKLSQNLQNLESQNGRNLIYVSSHEGWNRTSSNQHQRSFSQRPVDRCKLGIEEVFDILPIFGELQPGESQLVDVTFYGHASISSKVLALCEVEEGPVYEVTLRGEASRVTYTLDGTYIDFGAQLFDHVLEAELLLRNTGKVDFEFSVLQDQEGVTLSHLQPDLPLVLPNKGFVKGNTEQKLSLYYLPGTPEVFHKAFQLQVSHFEPEMITLRGEGIFPRIFLDLPRSLSEEKYSLVLKQAREFLERESQLGAEMSRPAARGDPLSGGDCIPTYDALLHMEVERLLVKENAGVVEGKGVGFRDTQTSSSSYRKTLTRFLLPEYVLDFGYVIHGDVPTHIVKVTNTGPVPVSFCVDHHHLAGSGFSMELDNVRNLPYCETETFEVKFDPRGANLELGEVTTVIHIKVSGGPTVPVHLCAVVTMPSLTISTDTLQFGTIQCGQCKVATIQLFNPEPVPCHWSTSEKAHARKKIDKHIPLYLRQRSQQEPEAPPVVFEMLPPTGVLLPAERVNVQVKFTPAEGQAYSQRLVISVAQSTQRVLLLALGEGEEPQLEFSSSLLELGPTLPFSEGEEAEVLVQNPCSFPIEFYSLEFDKQYLEEEKILGMMKAYASENVLLLPPRAPGETLPPELLDFYREQTTHKQELEEPKENPETALKGERRDTVPPRDHESEGHNKRDMEESPNRGLLGDQGGSKESLCVGELEENPVSKAIAHHMGIDLSPAAQAARNRRGIAIIVNGAPLSGKTETAVTLARYYGAACLSIDLVVQEAISSGCSTAGLQARQLCARAAQEQEAAQGIVNPTAPAGVGAILSEEALAKHATEGNPATGHKPASISIRNKTSPAGPAGNEGMQAAQAHRGQSVGEGGTGVGSCVLPEDLLVDMLSERLQLSDCHHGVVFDGLDTAYCLSAASALWLLLRAFDNRHFIYVVSLVHTYQDFQAQEKAQREAEEKQQRENEERERQRLQEMDEDEYDALPEEEKELIESRRLEEVRKRRERERAARENEQRRHLEEQERLREEEDFRKKNKKTKKEPPKEDVSGKKSQLGAEQSSAGLRSDSKLDQHVKETKKAPSVDNMEPKEFPTEGAREQKDGAKWRKTEGKGSGQEEASVSSDDPEREQLLSRFRQHEMSQAQVVHILQHWDRTQGLLLQAPSLEDRLEEPAFTSHEGQASSGKRGKKERERERAEKEQKKQKMDIPEPRLQPISPAPGKALPLGGDALEGADREVHSEGVPHLIVPVSGRGQSSATEILQNQKLPPLEEVLDGLGLGPRGPPVLPPTIFSMVSFPLRSQVLSEQPTSMCFTFMVPSGSKDTSHDQREVEKDGETLSAISLLKEEPETPTKGRGKKADVSREGHKERRRSPAKKGPKAPEVRSPPIGADAPMLEAEQSSQAEVPQERDQKLTTFRWVIPPNGTVTLKIRFHSSVPGEFDQMLNFEVMDTRRRYQLHCRGICGFPSISKDYRVVFAHCKKAQLPGSNMSKTYIIHSASYEFGPLLCGKNRDRYKERRYPENMETLVMHNCSPLKAEIHFCFLQDTKATTFMLDPPSMTLNPNEKQELTVWAYPTNPGLLEDSIVCCVKENPEPAVFRISCWGVRPELDLDRKQLQFDKVLLNRMVTKSLCLRNNTLLPVAWSLSGLEALGEEFTVSLDRSVVMPKSEYSLQVHFRASRPISLKKTIRLEVLDADNILGVLHTENIQIQAEAYDVLLDITFLKGTGLNGSKSDSILDFGTIRVSEEVKHSLALKNKGKYEVAFKFLLKGADQLMPDPNSLITVTPSSGSLHPNDRPSTVQFVFQHNKEVFIREQPIMSLQVIEPNIKEGGEVIGIMPIKVSVQSLFSRYSISPSEMNFGPLVYGSRKCLTFTIENRGTFEMRFNICRMPRDLPVPSQRKGMVSVKRTRSRESYSAKPPSGSKVRRIEFTQREMGLSSQARLTMGVFSVSPCFGILAPGAQQVVTVDCVADQAGSMEECVAVDVSDRDPNDHPNGVPYRLAAEVCVPEIVCDDMASVFEEHRICRNSSQLDSEEYRDATGIYIQDENKFVFNNVLVGRSAVARFCISNRGRVPCDLNLSIKSAMSRTSGRSAEVFELTSTKLCIPSHSQAFAVVNFCPQSMQAYSAVFEATLEASASSALSARTRALVFELAGDGQLPRVTLLRPLLQTPQGSPLLQFRPLLVGRTRALPLVLKNDGTVSAKVNLELLDETGVFTLRATADLVAGSDSLHTDSQSHTEGRVPQRASLFLTVGQQAEFEVEFRPNAEMSFKAKVHLLVVDNQYEDTVVQLVGDGYRDVITLDNVGSKSLPDSETADGNTSDILHFGACHVARPYQETCTMTNHSSSDVLRFEWPPESRQVRFSPRTGHLHAGCSKEVTVTFRSEQPVVLSAQPMKCKLCRVVFTQPIDQVPDWDDRLRTIRWVDVVKQAVAPRPAKMKVIESDPEPAHSVVENSSRELELRINGMCDYAKFTCKAENIHFKDTMLYQTRVFQFQLTNSGNILLEFTWQVLMEQNGKAVGFDHGGTPLPAPPRSQQAARMASRPASALESVSNLLLGDPNLPPFSVEPSAGTISPGHSLTFCVRFSPLEVSEWEGLLICSIPNLQDGQGPSMAVRGRSLLPDCHFHLEDSDYLTGGRRNPDMWGPNGVPPRATLDPNTRIIEVSSVGIGIPISKVFSIVNPTSKPYSFMWTCEDLHHATFKCLTPKGLIQPGKKAEVSFEFRAQDLNTVESFWTFMIPEQNISVPFLLVGMAREPVVYMDQTHLNLGFLLVGCKVYEKVYILNREEVPFHFSVRQTSCHSEACLNSLVLEPLMGTVEARDRFPLAISFSPTQEGPVTFNLVCDVRGKVQPLTVNVKAENFTFAACVQWQSVDGEVTELCPGDQHQMDFKQVELGDKALCHFLVSNPGLFGLDVQYELWGTPEMRRHLQVEPDSGVVPAGGQNSCTVTFFPLQKCVLRNTGLRIRVKNGPSFKCCFSGLAVNPSIHFSFLKHKFGKSFLYCAGMVPPTKTLVISNKGEHSVSLGCLYHNTVYLEVGFQPKTLLPGETMEVPISFYPREVMQYKEKVVFEINDSAKHVVEILGQGIELKIEVEDPKHKVINLGALQIGQKTKTVIPVVNNSQAPVTFSLLLNPSVQTLLYSKVLSVSPAGEVTLKSGGGRCSIELLFSPCHRMAPFKEELQLECLGTVCPLLVLRGCCHGIEVQIDQNHLPFGVVAKGCQVTRRIVMRNTGDMGARFKWDMKAFGPVFSITPTEGYICPEMVVPFDVTFAPMELSQDLRCDNVPCAIEGGKPIRLTLSGSCIAPPVIKEVVHFMCQVRTQHTQAIPLSNRSSQRCTLKPVLEGEHWSAPLTFVLEPGQQNKPYEITYKPMAMTADGKKHQGSIFFSFPDGTVLLYSLLGTSEPPKAAGTVSHEVPCKTHFTGVLPVLNWLSRSQRFRVIIEILKPERPDNTIAVKGLEYLDVPAATKRSYKLSFFSYREGNISTKVIFRNELTQEYLFYCVNFKATTPGIIHTVEMVASVRQMASATVTVENPLSVSLYLTTECRCADIFMPPQLFVPALSTAPLTFEYQPLRPGNSTARLTLFSSELGHFHYELLLQALPAPPEKPLCFRAPLGTGQYISAKFTNYSRAKAEYTCKTDSLDYAVEKNIMAPAGSQAGTDIGVDVYFEPSQLGETRATLTLSSSLGGDYIFPLVGTSLPPKAQGPFTIRLGSSISIPFKNVFLQTTTFSFQVDKPCFTVKGIETIRSKKTHNVVVAYEGPSLDPCTGKLTVSSPRSEGHGQGICWVFYLKGLSSELVPRGKLS